MTNQTKPAIEPQFNHADLKRFYSLPEVSEVTGISQSHIRTMSRNGDFPKQVKLGRHKVAWVIEEVNQWVNDKIAERGECA